MTANITVYTKEKNGVLVVPGKAVRFNPGQELLSEYMMSIEKGAMQSAGKIQNPADGSTNNITLDEQDDPVISRLWVNQNGMLVSKPVRLGETDGINYELISGVDENDILVLSLEKQTAPKAKASGSPFMPKPPGQRNSSSSTTR